MAFICDKCAPVSGVSEFEQTFGGRSRGACVVSDDTFRPVFNTGAFFLLIVVDFY